MKVIDPGHVYDLQGIDDTTYVQRLVFVKRAGRNYPGNVGSHPGVLTQEVLRACLDRALYMKGQKSCAETDIIIASLQTAIFAFEVRAARCRGASIEVDYLADIGTASACEICGHIQCSTERHTQPHWSETNPVA